MLLIADSGSTKTIWRLVGDNNHASEVITCGFNPFFVDSRYILSELKENLLPLLPAHLKAQKPLIYFYGAGCSSEERCNIVKVALQKLFPKAAITIDHDLLAAARGLCGRQRGIACIMGTGSNSCYYDGKKITDNIPALGYVLGDEGGGSYFGKKLVQSYLYREMPSAIEKHFLKQFALTKETILERIYHHAFPNRFLGSLTPFLSQHRHAPFISRMLADGINDFLERHICKYKKYQEVPIHFTGSVAYVFRDMIRSIILERKLKPGQIVQSPIDQLVDYHLAP